MQHRKDNVLEHEQEEQRQEQDPHGLNEAERLRLGLARDRIREITRESGAVEERYAPYFQKTAGEILTFLDTAAFMERAEAKACGTDLLKEKNRALYRDILPEHYKESWCCPETAAVRLGTGMGTYLAALAFEMRSMIPYLFEGAWNRALIRMELFLEVHSFFESAWRDCASAEKGAGVTGIPKESVIRGILYEYVRDYAQEELAYDVRAKLVTGSPRENEALSSADLADPRYLYRSGFYISENETGTAEHLAELPKETLRKMADTFTDGYVRGFEITGKDLAKKSVVNLIYPAGFERMMRRAQENFAALQKKCIAYRRCSSLFLQMGTEDGVTGGAANRQADYDHREDLALLLDDTLANRMNESLREAYRAVSQEAARYAGPAVLEPFGETPFTPEDTPFRPAFDRVQTRLVTGYRQREGNLYNEAVIGENRSFTVISFPVPEIADTEERYREIFDETIRLNTLDEKRYRRIQQKLIDALDEADTLEVRGRGANRTKLTVNLWKLSDPAHQTIFENCTADVNIPVGEVFTTPVLQGTDGLLHVTGVYLEGLYYRDLALTFRDGCVTDYSCANFAGQEDADAKGRRYIEENILFHHSTLPMGECAIGTNTEAYAAGVKYGISGRYGILIAEKTGPHFAVGDTCYCHEEELRTCNPDGKELVAKENDFSRLRDTDPGRAYFDCHTDITIPYSEIGSIEGVRKDGTRIPVIRDGRFVLPGTEELNRPLDALEEKTQDTRQ